MPFLRFLIRLIGYFTLGCLIILSGMFMFGYVKFNHAMDVIEEVETTYTKQCGDAKNITIKNNKVYCDGKLIKRIEE